MESNRTAKNAQISEMILNRVAQGVAVPQAIDEVLGAGTYQRVIDELWDAFQAKAKA
jgi:hypothetical protein